MIVGIEAVNVSKGAVLSACRRLLLYTQRIHLSFVFLNLSRSTSFDLIYSLDV